MYKEESPEQVVSNYDRLLRKLVNEQYIATPKYSSDDMLQEARIIALSCISSWDEEKGYKFIKYLTWKVEWGLKRFRKENSYDIAITEHKQDDDWKRELAKRDGREIEKDSTRSPYFDTLRHGLAARLDWPVGIIDGEEMEMGDIIPSGMVGPAETAEIKERAELVRASIEELSPRERYVVDSIFFGDKNISEVADIMCVAPSTVQRIQQTSIQKLSDILRTKLEHDKQGTKEP